MLFRKLFMRHAPARFEGINVKKKNVKNIVVKES